MGRVKPTPPLPVLRHPANLSESERFRRFPQLPSSCPAYRLRLTRHITHSSDSLGEMENWVGQAGRVIGNRHRSSGSASRTETCRSDQPRKPAIAVPSQVRRVGPYPLIRDKSTPLTNSTGPIPPTPLAESPTVRPSPEKNPHDRQADPVPVSPRFRGCRDFTFSEKPPIFFLPTILREAPTPDSVFCSRFVGSPPSPREQEKRIPTAFTIRRSTS